MKAVKFDKYGGIDVLDVREVDKPTPSDGQVLVAVKAASINPGEAIIRQGLLDDQFPTTFPCGEGSDFAGVVADLGAGVTAFAVGDEVLGFTDERASHAEFVAVSADQLVAKPQALSWDVAGSLFVAGGAAYAAVRAVRPAKGETVAVSGATGGVGVIAVQLARRSGATVLGIAGPSNDDWLAKHDIVAVNYGSDFSDLADRLKAAAPTGRVDAFVDLFGGGYAEMAVNKLGVEPSRVSTIIDFAAGERLGVHVTGTADAATTDVLTELANLAASGELDIPIADVFALDDVGKAYQEIEQRHTRGKIVLRP